MGQLKAEKRAEREEQAAQRTVVKAQRRQEINDRRQQRERAKEANEQAALARKRRTKVDEQNEVSKRRRLNHLQALAEQLLRRIQQTQHSSSISVPEMAISSPRQTSSASGPAQEEEGACARQSHYRQRVKLPAHFKQLVNHSNSS